MAAFTDVIASDHKGLKRAELLGLGRINVVCGANNSGKTTLLECLTLRERHVTGKPSAQFDAERLEREYLRGNTWHVEKYRETFIQCASQIIATKARWFEADANFFRDRFIEIALEKRLGISRSDHLREAFISQIGASPSAVIVSAKRNLNFRGPVNNSSDVHPNGEGVLNALFIGKNSPRGNSPRKNFDKIHGAFGEITGGWIFDIILFADNNLQLVFSRTGDKWLNGEDCGLGFRDLLIILYFSLASDVDVVILEEPENHQHPEIQRKLIAFLKDSTDKQFFISTHSSVFSNTLYADRVFNCKIEEEVIVTNVTSRAQLLASLGYSVADNLISDLVILVEGPSDKTILEEFFRKMGLTERYIIRIWPLGGDIMNQHDLSVLSDAYRLIALIDTDPQSRKVRDSFKAKCAERKIPVHQLASYAIENYFSLPIIERMLNQKAPVGMVNLDPNKKVSEQLGFEVKGNAAAIAREMSLDDLKGTDLMSFLEKAEGLLTGK